MRERFFQRSFVSPCSHTWFALRYILGYDNVRNYDGSWTEWGNLVGSPIRKGAEA